MAPTNGPRSLPCPRRVSSGAAVRADAESRQARPRILRHPDQQRPHAQGVPQRDAALRRMVRAATHRRARPGAAPSCRRLREGVATRLHRAHGQAAPGRATHAVRLARDRPSHRGQSGSCRARSQICRAKRQDPCAHGRGGARAARQHRYREKHGAQGRAGTQRTLACRLTRSRAYRGDGLQFRAHQRRA